MAKSDGGRVANSVRNGAYGLAFYALTLVLSFVSNRVFVHRLGADMLGLCGALTLRRWRGLWSCRGGYIGAWPLSWR